VLEHKSSNISETRRPL